MSHIVNEREFVDAFNIIIKNVKENTDAEEIAIPHDSYSSRDITNRMFIIAWNEYLTAKGKDALDASKFSTGDLNYETLKAAFLALYPEETEEEAEQTARYALSLMTNIVIKIDDTGDTILYESNDTSIVDSFSSNKIVFSTDASASDLAGKAIAVKYTMTDPGATNPYTSLISMLSSASSYTDVDCDDGAEFNSLILSNFGIDLGVTANDTFAQAIAKINAAEDSWTSPYIEAPKTNAGYYTGKLYIVNSGRSNAKVVEDSTGGAIGDTQAIVPIWYNPNPIVNEGVNYIAVYGYGFYAKTAQNSGYGDALNNCGRAHTSAAWYIPESEFAEFLNGTINN